MVVDSANSLLARTCQALDEVQKILTDEAKDHIAKTAVSFKYTGHPRIHSSSCRAKSWELNYPAMDFMVNGGYYSDYASVMGTMGLPVMHHST